MLMRRVNAQQPQQIIITEQGLLLQKGRTGLSSSTHWIAWRDARLFAMYDYPPLNKNARSVVFELASADQIISWTWLRPDRFVLGSQVRPIALSEEYNAQMRALLSLIAAGTGLPLYDLRTRGKIAIPQ